MRSRANIKGHSIHPILVTFPIAFFVGAFISDVILYAGKNEFFGVMGKYLEAGGIISALLAAVPGIIDYYSVVPPESSAKKRATKHGLLNISMLFVFLMALLMRRNADVDFIIILLMEGTGIILLTIAGWHGGTLVSRNQIGIDHRYAGAGKWKEEVAQRDVSGRFELKDLEKLNVNQMKLYHVKGKRIVVGRTETKYVAFDDHCSHRGGSLADGVMICGAVQCPWHGSQFDVMSGAVKAGPAKEQIKAHKVENEDGKYYLEI